MQDDALVVTTEQEVRAAADVPEGEAPELAVLLHQRCDVGIGKQLAEFVHGVIFGQNRGFDIHTKGIMREEMGISCDLDHVLFLV